MYFGLFSYTICENLVKFKIEDLQLTVSLKSNFSENYL